VGADEAGPAGDQDPFATLGHAWSRVYPRPAAAEPVPQAAKAGQTAGGAEASDSARAELEKQWGIKLLGIRRTAAGYGLDFRYEVVDAEKATPILQRKFSRDTHLVVEKSGARLGVPFSEKVGSMRTSVRTANQIKEGRRYFVLFANPARHVEAGDKVTVVIGKFRVEHLVVQ